MSNLPRIMPDEVDFIIEARKNNLTSNQKELDNQADFFGLAARQSLKGNFENHATALKISRESGLNFGLVDRNLAKVEQDKFIYDSQKMVADKPRTHAYFSEVQNAKIGLDALPNFVKLESLLHDQEDNDFFKSIEVGSEQGDLVLEKYSILQQMRAQGRTVELEIKLNDIKAKERELAEYESFGPHGYVAQNMASQLDIQGLFLKEQAKGALVGATLGGTAGSFLGGVGAVPGAVIGAKAGATAYTFSAAYDLESLLAEEDFRDMGIEPSAAKMASRVYGFLAGIVEMPEAFLGAKIALSPFEKGKSLVKQGVKKALLEFIKDTGKLQLAEGVEEMTQEALKVGIGEVTKGLTGLESDQNLGDTLTQMFNSGLQAVATPFGALYSTPKLAVNILDAKRGGSAEYKYQQAIAQNFEQEQKLLDSLSQDALDNPLAKRDALSYEQAVATIKDGGAVQDVYIPASAVFSVYANEQERNQVLQGLGVDNFGEALMSGADLIIPLEKYSAYIAQNNEFALRIENDRRFSSDSLTKNEYKEFIRSNSADFKQAIESAMLEEASQTKFEQELEEINYAVENQLTVIGEKSDLAKANASQVSAFFGTIAQKSQISPRALFDRYYPDLAKNGQNIEANEVLFPIGEQGVYEQAMPKAKEKTLDEFVKNTLENTDQTQKSVFTLGNMQRSDKLYNNINVVLATDQVKHIIKRHPNFDSFDKILNVINNGTVYEGDINSVTHQASKIFISEGEKKNFVVVGSTNKAHSFVVNTAFEDSKESTKNWLKNKKPMQNSNTPQEAEQSIGAIGNENIAKSTDEVNLNNTKNLEQSSPKPKIVLTGKELGVSGTNIKDYIKAAREVYRKLQDSPAFREDLGEIKFTKIGFSELKFTGSNIEKWQLIPALKEIIETATYINKAELNKVRKDDITAFHWLENYVQLEDKVLHVGVQIAEDIYGNKFYNLNNDIEAWNKKYNALNQDQILSSEQEQKKNAPNLTVSIKQRVQEQASNEVLKQNMAQSADNVNMQILETVEPRGRISFSTPSGRPLIELFAKADASTFLHETGHLYLEMLRDLGSSINATSEIASLWQDIKLELGKNYQISEQEISLEAHESFASSLEQYFMQGKAPSLKLQKVFERFSAWLRAIYNSFRKLDPKVNKNLEPLFARIFASEAEIAQLEDLHKASEPYQEIAKQFTPKDKQNLELAQVEARVKRYQRLTKAYIQAYGGKALIASEMKKEVEALPVYRAMHEAMQGIGIDYEAVEQDFGLEVAQKLNKKKLLKREGGEEPELLAMRHGFRNVNAMISQMFEAEPKSKLIKSKVEARVQEIEALLIQGDQEKNVLAGEEEYHSEARLAVLMAEYRILQNKQNRANAKSKIELQAVKELAKETLAKQKVKYALNYKNFASAERKAVVKYYQALSKNKLEEATKYKREEILAHALFTESMALRAEIRKAENFVHSLRMQKNLGLEARRLSERLVYQFGFASYKGLSQAKSYPAYLESLEQAGEAMPLMSEFEENYANLGYPIYFENSVKELSHAQNYKELKLEAFRDVIDAFKQIRTVDKLERTALLNGERKEMQELVEKLNKSITKNKKRIHNKLYGDNVLKQAIKNLHAWHAKIEVLLLDFDGGKHGIWWETIFKPIADAEDKRNLILKGIKTNIDRLFSLLAENKELSTVDKFKLFQTKTFITEIDEFMTKEQILSVALNVGNEGNKQRLLEGNAWNISQLEAVLDKLTLNEWEFVQGVWDYLETFKADSFALQEKLTGKKSKEVMPSPVQTKFGTFRGGYYHIKYKKESSASTYAQEQKNLDMQLFGGRNYGTSQTQHGHLKERASKGKGDPLAQNLSVLSSYLYDMAHDLSHREAVLEVAKVLRQKDVKDMIISHAGHEVYNQFIPWLQNIAREVREPSNEITKILAWARKGATITSMGLKFTTAFTQITGFTQTLEVLGFKFASLGVKEVYGRNFVQAYKEITQKSVFMENRIRDFDRDIKYTIDKMYTAKSIKALDQIQKFSFLPIAYMQMGVDLPTWQGAYRKALSESKTEEQAISYADSIVRISQGSGSTKDLARIQRWGGDVGKMFTMFYSYFNVLYNLAYRAIGKKADNNIHKVMQLASSALLLWFLPVVLSELLAGRAPDEDEDILEWGVINLAQYPFQTVVGIRDIANGVLGKFAYQLTPAESSLTKLVAWGKATPKAFEEEDFSLLIKPSIQAAGVIFGLPTGQMEITLGNIWDYATGQSDFELRDLFFRRPQSRR